MTKKWFFFTGKNMTYFFGNCRGMTFLFDRERMSKPKKQATVKPISAQDQKTLDTAIALANEISTRSMTTPAPTTPVSPNKRKFSFRFPSVSEHEKNVEKRNFSEEARSSPDLQVRERYATRDSCVVCIFFKCYCKLLSVFVLIQLLLKKTLKGVHLVELNRFVFN